MDHAKCMMGDQWAITSGRNSVTSTVYWKTSPGYDQICLSICINQSWD